MLKKSNGFGLPYILGILVLVIVVVAGIIVYRNHHNTNNQATNKASTTQKNTSTTNQTVPAQQYLTINEWGVKLPLSDAISDAYYVPNSTNQPDGMWLGLKSLDSKGCEAAQANSGGKYPIGTLIKKLSNDTDAVTGVAVTKQEPYGTTIGQYYYAYHSGVQGSSTDCTTNANIPNISAIDTAFKEAAKNIVAE